MLKKHVIETHRLRIELLSDGEHENIIASTEDIELMRLCEAILDNCISNPKMRQWSAFWKVYLKEDNIEIGSIRFLGEPLNGTVEIVNDIENEYHGNGYVTETVNAMTDWALSQEKVYIVFEEVQPYDELSIAGLNMIGFIEYGQGVEGIMYAKKRPREKSFELFSVIGLILGVISGLITNCLLYGFGFGFGFGLIAGAVMQMIDYKLRDDICGDNLNMFEKNNAKI